MAEPRPASGGIINFRDVSNFVNDVTGTQRLRTGFLFRSARPEAVSFQDRQRIFREYGIKSVIDLRTKTEHIEQAQKRDAALKASGSKEHVKEPLKLPGVIYHEINFNGSSYSRMLISKLSWYEFFRLVGLMLLGHRKDAIKILAPHMEEMGLVGLATVSLDVCKREVKQVFDVFADERNWPVLVHCTQGKDRTGLVVMLVLFLLHVDEKAINEDYEISEPELQPEKAERVKEIQSIGLSEDFAVCPPDLVEKVSLHIQEKYGGIEPYLEKAGVGREQMDFIKKKLLASAS